MSRHDLRQMARFVVNGVAATLAHFASLTFLVEVAGVASRGLANGMAALVGITVSFVGNKWFVFPESRARASGQLVRFLALYAALALINAGLMMIWADVGGLDYRVGFVLITGVQLACSFLGNRYLVFR